ncbi:MAG: ATP-dependent Clp protease ATP-binding subunit [Candidatus Cryptobacteroides sp.]
MEIKLSEELTLIVEYARQEALRTGSYGIAPDHLYLGILRHSDNNACDILRGLETDTDEFKHFIDSKIFTHESIPYEDEDNIKFSREAQNVLSLTVLEATRFRSPLADSQHLLLALCRTVSGYGTAYLRDTGIDYGRVLVYMRNGGMLTSGGASDNSAGEAPGEDASGGNAEGGPAEVREQERASSIEDFGYDLTKAAAEGRLDPVVGREEEMERVIEILGRRKKNNPMLVGEPGVGKSAIVEGIALRIAEGTVPKQMLGKRIISLDIASVVAGTKYRGDFEKRLKGIIKEISDNPDIILFIDEFHTIVGAGGASGSLDAANMLKPALARGEIQCIGATTAEEFRKIVEKDGALDRRFQKILVEPSDFAHSVGILKKIRGNYEEHHQVRYSDEALEACVRLSERYVTDRCLPDKAIDAMDEAGSMVHLGHFGHKRASDEVTPEDIAAVISRMTGIPTGKVAESESARLLRMKEKLSGKVIGQEEAIDTVVRAIHRNRAGIKDVGRPIGTFIFFGPTGVGKTLLAKEIAEYLFDSADSLIRLDMSEYMEKFTASRLIGAPPGYVGFDEGGQLSERVRRKPYSVVLLDEIEKAHPDIFNLLLQVLDEGRLTDSTGRTVSFRNTILIMTSNVGSREIEEYGNGVGFSTGGKDLSVNRRVILEKAVKKVFPPEFINRIDAQVFFRQLERQDLERITDVELKAVKERVKGAGFRLSVTPSAKRFVAEAGYDPQFGARPLKRALQKYVEDPVSEFIIGYRLAEAAGGKAAHKADSRAGKQDGRKARRQDGNGRGTAEGASAGAVTIKVSLSADKSSTTVTSPQVTP